MATSMERIAKLEWANYAATLPLARVTPELELVLRDDVILTSSQTFPTPDANHACLLRADARGARDLIAEVIAYFESRQLSTVIYVSPACAPRDLPARLLEAGFERQAEAEAWMVLEDLPHLNVPSTYPGVTVRPITGDQAIVFAEIFMASFNMPRDFAPVMAQLLEPSLGLPTVHHYLAFYEGQPIGACSVLRHGRFGVLGSTGVVSDHRGSGAATNLTVRAVRDARENGVETMMLQTTADTRLERLLRISGFKRAFARSCYVLCHESLD